MTRYRLVAAQHLGPFESATEAVLCALTLGIDSTWVVA